MWGHATGPGLTRALCESQGVFASLAFLSAAMCCLLTVVMYANLQVMNHDEMAYFLWKDAPLLFLGPIISLLTSVIMTGIALRVRVRANYTQSAVTGYMIGAIILLMCVFCVVVKMNKDVHGIRVARIDKNMNKKMDSGAVKAKQADMARLRETFASSDMENVELGEAVREQASKTKKPKRVL